MMLRRNGFSTIELARFEVERNVQALGHEFQGRELLTHDTGLRLLIGRGLAYTIILLLACELLPGMYHQLVFLMGAI